MGKRWRWQLHPHLKGKYPDSGIPYDIPARDIEVWHNDDGSWGGMRVIELPEG